ncbi:DNA alkylation repair protein [Parapedobacter indicus]|uniref:3-methyladenine DNA glycosylase AlkD n=1 Tax=Parapedobacter indicus TaxID=1477437 RepID=A0A1I3Q5T4_9SPHI|nr:DNA alkylation repair protein [Parapedobacter indicus]PPL00665.1 3-methyladenine DNA glycosylase AlkD [Parapedobacter indicus]SFJ28486.1 3-methyladenine DNA glycosylase AlkD [Parapedobacter indicus]
MEVIEKIRNELTELADGEVVLSQQRFFKEPIKSYGVKLPLAAAVGRKLMKETNKLTKSEIITCCDILWESGYFEESIIACNLMYSIRKQFKPDDFLIIERWLRKCVTNWASCDTLCNHTVGTLIEMFPVNLERLKDFTQSENRWLRRAAAVSLIIPAKNGKFVNDIFEITDNLLEDNDDLVQKGYGWLLKAASKSHQDQVFDYVMKNKSRMPRTALRYAIEKMAKELKEAAMLRL